MTNNAFIYMDVYKSMCTHRCRKKLADVVNTAVCRQSIIRDHQDLLSRVRFLERFF